MPPSSSSIEIEYPGAPSRRARAQVTRFAETRADAVAAVEHRKVANPPLRHQCQRGEHDGVDLRFDAVEFAAHADGPGLVSRGFGVLAAPANGSADFLFGGRMPGEAEVDSAEQRATVTKLERSVLI